MEQLKARSEFLRERLARHDRTTYKPLETPFMAAASKGRGNG